MIGHTGIFPHNEYFEHTYALDGIQPQGMARTWAVVLALDVSEQPFRRRMDYDAAETATDAEIEAYHKRFEAIDEQKPGPLPLQVYDGEPLIVRTVKNLRAAGVAGVTVVTGAHAEEVAEALKGLDVELVAYDAQAVAELDAQGAYAEFCYLSRGQLLWAVHAAARGDACDAFIVVHGDEATFEPRHYAKLRAVFEEHPQADFVPAYVEWHTTLPALFTRRFLRELEKPESELAPVDGATVLSLHHYQVPQAIMGEEKLIGACPLPDKALKARPDEKLPASALASVRAARHEPDELERREAKVLGKKPDAAVGRAKAFLKRLDAAVAAHPIDDLDVYDAWAQRNRLDLPILSARENRNLVYLDSAATSLRASNVIAACDEFAAHYDANIWRSMYANSIAATVGYQAAREKFARFIHADPRDCIFTTNTTDSLNLVAQAWGRHNLKAGDLVCVAASEHHSNYLPWQLIAENLGCKLELIALRSDGRIDETVYDELLARKPKLVCLAQISNIIGLENPAAEMGRRAHEAGAVVVVDAAQSIPHVPLDVREMNADFIACSGHKMHAPTGIGVLWARPERVAEMVPYEVGGGTISEVSYEGTYYRQSPYCFEYGTPPIEQAIGLGAAVDYLQGLGMDNVKRHARAMSRYALAIAELVPGIGIWGDHSSEDGALGLLSYSTRHIGCVQVSMLLGRMGIATRAGAHCAVPFTVSAGIPGTTRISFGPYTTKGDLEAWGFAMSEIVRIATCPVGRS